MDNMDEIRLISATTTNAFGKEIKGRKKKYRIKLKKQHGLRTKNGFYVAVPIKEVCDIMKLSAVPQLIMVEGSYAEAIIDNFQPKRNVVQSGVPLFKICYHSSDDNP